MKSLNLQILPQHFFYSVLSVGASLLIWTSRVPSPPAPPPAAAAASPPCMFSPHQYALQLLNVRATRTVRDGKKESGANIYDREAMSAHISHLTPSTASCWLFRGSVYFLAFLGGGQSMDLLWIWRVSVSAVDCRGVSSLLLLPSCFTITKRKRGDVCFAQASSISRLVRTGYRFDCVLRKKVSDLLIIFFFFLFWEAKVIAWADWCGSQGDVFFSLLLLSFQRQWTGQHVFCEGDGG